MRTDFFIARRLKLSEEGSRRSAVSIRISTIGVALSIAIMLLTIAIVTGFKQQITEKIIGFDSEITVSVFNSAYDESQPVELTPEVESIIRQAIPDAEIGSSVTQPAMLKTADNFAAVVFRGFSGPAADDFVRRNIVEGTAPDFAADSAANSIVLSRQIADKLDLKPGDRINTVFFVDGRMRIRNFDIAGLYCSNFGEYDKTVAYAPISTLRHIRGLADDEADAVCIDGLPVDRIDEAANNLQYALNSAYYNGSTPKLLQAVSVRRTGAIYFNWLDLLDTNVVVIIILMSAISMFTLIASLFIIILERVAMIGTLKTIGASDSLIRRIFIILASKIMLRGLLIGNAVGLAFIAAEARFRFVPLDPESYYISFVPVSITAADVILLNVVAVIAAVAVMIIPSMVITRMSAARTVRFE